VLSQFGMSTRTNRGQRCYLPRRSRLSDARSGDLGWIRSKRWVRYVSRANVVPATSGGVRHGMAGDDKEDELLPGGWIGCGVVEQGGGSVSRTKKRSSAASTSQPWAQPPSSVAILSA
jgi:hypothetical protein